MKNSIEEDIRNAEHFINSIKTDKEYEEENGWHGYYNKEIVELVGMLEHILSDYKRALKENEELKEDRKNNNEMIALAQNEILNYMSGYEEGKKHKMTAVAQVVENQQYYIIRKQMEKYEEHIKRLQKENEELNLKYNILYTEKIEKQKAQEVKIKSQVISKQKVKDKIEHYQKLQDNYIEKYDEINEGLQAMINALQELLEGRK